MKLYDAGEISKREITKEGFLKVSSKVAKVGIQEYYSSDFEAGEVPEYIRNTPRAIRLFRSESEVSDPESLATIETTPITDGHPSEFINAGNVKQYQVGFSKPGVRYEHGFVLADLIIQDAAVVKRAQAGHDKISLGYNSKIKWGSGTDQHYGDFDGEVTRIRVNHIAVVSGGARGGPEVRLDDQQTEGDNSMADKKDGNATDKSVEIVDSLKGQVAVLEANLTDAKSEVEKLQGALDAANKRIETELDAAVLDARVSDRLALIDNARKLHSDIDTDGKSDVEIKSAAILHLNDSFDLKDKSSGYIDGVFESMAASAKETDGLVKDLKDSTEQPKNDARAKFVERSRNAFKRGTK